MSITPLPVAAPADDDELLKQLIPEAIRKASAILAPPPSLVREEKKQARVSLENKENIMAEGVSQSTLASVAAKEAANNARLARTQQVLAYIKASEEA